MMKISRILNRFFYYLRMLLKPRTLKSFIISIRCFLDEYVSVHEYLNKDCSAYIHSFVSFREPQNIYIGKNTRIQPYACLWASPNSKIIIGDYSGIGPKTMLFSSNHKYQFGKRYIDQPWIEKDIIIGKNVWIGAGCIITSGVNIGEGSVIGAGSIVTKNIPPFSLALGNPAKIIKNNR